MKKEHVRNVGAVLLASVFGLAAGSAAAAESAAGVKEHMDLMVKTVKEANEHAAAGHQDMCVDSIKQSIQHYKELTGDAAGKPLQDAVKKIKAAKDACQAGDPAEAAAVLADTIPALEKVQAGLK
jgi:hypothetical protein